MIASQASCEHIYIKSPKNEFIRKFEKVRIRALNYYKGTTYYNKQCSFKLFRHQLEKNYQQAENTSAFSRQI